MKARSQVFAALAALACAVSVFAQSATLTPSATTLNSGGGTLVFEFNCIFSGTALFKLDVTLPAGWSYLSGAGEPGIKPGAGAEATLSWLDVNPLPSPVRFSFTVSYPAGSSALAVSSSVTLRQDGVRTDLIPGLVLSGAKPAIAAQPVSKTVTLGDTATLSVVVGGTGPFTYQWRRNGAILVGATAATLNVKVTSLTDTGSFSVGVTSAFGTVSSTVANLTITPADGGAPRDNVEKLINIATRGAVGGVGGEMTVGFYLGGNAPKQVMVRAIGPTLAAFGVERVLAAPRLELFNGSASVATSTAWGASSNIAAVANAAARSGAFALDPGSRDAVLLVTLEPGAYTAVVSGENGATGVALVEVYDVPENATAGQRIVNLASRGTAGSGDETLSAGFFINGIVPKRVLLRGVGPGLAAYGVTGPLADPSLKLFNQSGAVVATNDNWGESADAATLALTARSVGAFALAPGSRDAALVLNLTPGLYTIQLGGPAGTTGAALVEIYEVP